MRNNLKAMLVEYYGAESVKKLPSQAVIAQDFEVSQTTVSRWMAEKIDRFDADVLQKFCKKLRCNVGDLIYYDMNELLVG